jgi:hypothetical protein
MMIRNLLELVAVSNGDQRAFGNGDWRCALNNNLSKLAKYVPK